MEKSLFSLKIVQLLMLANAYDENRFNYAINVKRNDMCIIIHCHVLNQYKDDNMMRMHRNQNASD